MCLKIAGGKWQAIFHKLRRARDERHSISRPMSVLAGLWAIETLKTGTTNHHQVVTEGVAQIHEMT